jgi:hypothetical protein
MRDMHRNATRSLAIAVLVLLAGVSLAACGGGNSSSSNTSGAANSGTTPTVKSPSGKPPSTASNEALRACLKKNGITIPPGTTPATGLKLPKGVTAADFQVALNKCSPGANAPKGTSKAPKGTSRFLACMRDHGAVGVSLTSPKYAAAYKICVRQSLTAPTTSLAK